MMALLGTITAQAVELDTQVDTLKSVELQDVQVVSTRATKKTPMAFTNMDKEQLKAVNFGQDIPYLLSLTPSVTMTSDAGNGIGYTSLRIRGTDPSRINITANGIPLNDAESAQLYWVNMGDFASSVQSMQIQRGVGTSTNGAGAFGATLNMQTENIGIEPFVGLDPKATFQLKGIMREMCEKGTAVFFSTHVLDVAEKLCNKVAIIRKGKIIAAGTMEELTAGHSLEEAFLESDK